MYTYGHQRLDAEREGGNIDAYLYDGRGSVAQVFDGAEVVQNLTYDPYGEIVSGANGNDIIFGYNAEEYNPVTGLQYLRARYYAPEMGGFISEDSVRGNLSDISATPMRRMIPSTTKTPPGTPSGNPAMSARWKRRAGLMRFTTSMSGRCCRISGIRRVWRLIDV